MLDILHQILARHRFRNNYGWEHLGRIRYELDPQTGLIRAYTLLRSMPVGGFDGYLLGLPLDAVPPSREQQPKRPAALPDDPEAAQDEALFDSLCRRSD